MALRDLLLDPNSVDQVFLKVLANNDDSGRHGVVIPVGAYGYFPYWEEPIRQPHENHTMHIRTIHSGRGKPINSCIKYYHRYPERRLTSLRYKPIVHADRKPIGSVLVVARRTDSTGLFEIHLLNPAKPEHFAIAQSLGLIESGDIGWRILSVTESFSSPPEGLDWILEKFDATDGEWVDSRESRRIPKAVGTTAQLIVGMTNEDNFSGPDVGEVELKGMIAADLDSASTVDLFLLAPKWKDSLRPTQRVIRYGYLNGHGRHALKVSVRADRINPQGFCISTDRIQGLTHLTHDGLPVATWRNEKLQERLNEKMTSTLYALADRRRGPNGDQFRYHTLVLARNPDVESLLTCIERGDVSVELRMHVSANGSARDHGVQFRIRSGRLMSLFSSVTPLRNY